MNSLAYPEARQISIGKVYSWTSPWSGREHDVEILAWDKKPHTLVGYNPNIGAAGTGKLIVYISELKDKPMPKEPSHEERMRDLIDILNDAREKYYSGTEESPLTDSQYDLRMKELAALELSEGKHFPDSPAEFAVGFEPFEAKVKHQYPILSLKDTKNVDELVRFLGEEDGLLSWKLDGVSIVLYYKDGILDKALSRGDGHIGKDITKNVILMKGVPRTIQQDGTLIVRGEGVIGLSDFDAIKQTEEGDHYSNPRNMVAGLVNRTTSVSPLTESMHFVAHTLVAMTPENGRIHTRNSHLQYLEELGFEVVPNSMVHNFDMRSEISRYTAEAELFAYPVDGLVLAVNNIRIANSMGSTARYPKHSMAFKWPDVSALTKVTGVEWSMSPTGLLTPIVIFEPVILEGTTVKRANLYNLKKFKDLGIGFGDVIKVHKANKIIPEIIENLTRSGTAEYPVLCPVCGKPTTQVVNRLTEKLYCWHCKHPTISEG